jgi:RNA polymerase sigma factor (sigma-70 family)
MRPHFLLGCHPERAVEGLAYVRDVVAREEDDAALYRRVAPELTGFATALVGRHDAADVVSNAVVRSLATPQWSSVSDRRAYLYRSVFNEAQRWKRRAGLRRDREARAAAADLWELPDFDPEVRSAVERLSVRQRAVVLLTYWADLDPVAIGDLLGISEGAVRRHLARARARLRKVLDV